MKMKVSLVLCWMALSWSLSSPAQTSAEGSVVTPWQASLSSEASQDYDGALKNMEEYQTSGGDLFLKNLRAAWLYYLKKDYVNAARLYTEAEQLKPGALNPLLGLLNVRQAEAKSTRIAGAAADVLHVDPLNYRAQMVLAYQDFIAKHYDQALGGYQKVLAVYPDDTTALSGQAWSFYYLGKTGEGAATFQLLLGINAADTSASKGLSLCQKK